MPEMQPNKAQREALQKVVKDMDFNIKTLQASIQTLIGTEIDVIHGNEVIGIIRDIITNQNSFKGWNWYPNTWENTRAKLKMCVKKLRSINVSKPSPQTADLVLKCRICVRDILTYKTICDDISKKDETSDGISDQISWKDRVRKFFSLKSKLEALKDLAS